MYRIPVEKENDEFEQGSLKQRGNTGSTDVPNHENKRQTNKETRACDKLLA
jgi:hypothetical protein